MFHARFRPAVLATVAGCLALGFAVAPGQDVPQPVTGDVARGAELYKTICAECHGEKAGGIKEKLSPALHQQEDWYLLASLQKFREGIRGAAEGDSIGASMREKAQALPDDQAMSDVVAFIKTIEGPPPMPATLQGDLEAGKATFTTICVACHGPDGRGMAVVKSPSLVGQSDWYMLRQIQKFRAGKRGADPRDVTGMQMKAMMVTLTTDQMVEDVVTYARTLE